MSGDERREFDYPSATYLPIDDFGQQIGWSLAQMVTQTDTGLADIIRERYPDALWGEDSFGNTIVVADGQPYYLNRPGLDAVDITRYGPSLFLQGRLFKSVAGLGGRLPEDWTTADWVARPLAGLSTAGGVSPLLDIASRQFGSRVPVGGSDPVTAEAYLKSLLKLSWRTLLGL